MGTLVDDQAIDARRERRSIFRCWHLLQTNGDVPVAVLPLTSVVRVINDLDRVSEPQQLTGD
tara:strand:+ start:186 stop:371 length:186 start_codon:yes stop_codon:yes gene_type:complete